MTASLPEHFHGTFLMQVAARSIPRDMVQAGIQQAFHFLRGPIEANTAFIMTLVPFLKATEGQDFHAFAQAAVDRCLLADFAFKRAADLMESMNGALDERICDVAEALQACFFVMRENKANTDQVRDTLIRLHEQSSAGELAHA